MPLVNALTIKKLFHVSAGTNLAGPRLSDDVNHRKSRCQPPQGAGKKQGPISGQEMRPQ